MSTTLLTLEQKRSKLSAHLAGIKLTTDIDTTTAHNSLTAINLAFNNTISLFDVRPACICPILTAALGRLELMIQPRALDSSRWKAMLVSTLETRATTDVERQRVEVFIDWMWSLFAHTSTLAVEYEFGGAWWDLYSKRNKEAAQNLLNAKITVDGATIGTLRALLNIENVAIGVRKLLSVPNQMKQVPHTEESMWLTYKVCRACEVVRAVALIWQAGGMEDLWDAVSVPPVAILEKMIAIK